MLIQPCHHTTLERSKVENLLILSATHRNGMDSLRPPWENNNNNNTIIILPAAATTTRMRVDFVHWDSRRKSIVELLVWDTEYVLRTVHTTESRRWNCCLSHTLYQTNLSIYLSDYYYYYYYYYGTTDPDTCPTQSLASTIDGCGCRCHGPYRFR